MRKSKKVLTMAAAVAIAASGWGIGSATAGSEHIAANEGKEPANLDLVKDDVHDYYGDYLDPSGKHHASEHSQWGKDVAAQVGKAKRFVGKQLSAGVKNPAMVLDIDDTSVNTYDYEANFNFQDDDDEFFRQLKAGTFTTMTPTLEFTKWATKRGVKLFFVTGRKENQRAATVRDMSKKGFPDPAGLFLKPTTKPLPWLPCGLDCNTIQYKSGTRDYLERQGNTVLLTMGDQNSDLEGGHAKLGVKLPNPMYYLP